MAGGRVSGPRGSAAACRGRATDTALSLRRSRFVPECVKRVCVIGTGLSLRARRAVQIPAQKHRLLTFCRATGANGAPTHLHRDQMGNSSS